MASIGEAISEGRMICLACLNEFEDTGIQTPAGPVCSSSCKDEIDDLLDPLRIAVYDDVGGEE